MELITLCTSLVDFSGVSFSGLTDTINAVIPVAMPVVVTLLGIRKGISFMLGMIRGA